MDEVGLAVAGSLRDIRGQIRAMLADVEASMELPQPTESGKFYAGCASVDTLWDTQWQSGTWYCDETLKVIVHPEPGADNPCVYLRGLTGSGDLVAMSTENAIRVGRALLAAAKAAEQDARE